ncbi:MAG: Rab family GTPase [Candidatus Hermodarchaeota archaeon]
MYEYVLKIIVLGPGSVGKSSIIRRFVKNEFSFDYKFTIGVEINSKIVEYEKGSFAQLTIWDIGGQERFKILRRNFYEGTYGALVVFDLSRPQTFSKMKEWISDLNVILEKEVPIIILGNKADLIPEIGEVLDQDEIVQFAENLDSVYLQTSAKTGNNVQEAFAQLAKIIVKNTFGE